MESNEKLDNVVRPPAVAYWQEDMAVVPSVDRYPKHEDNEDERQEMRKSLKKTMDEQT